LLFNNLLIKLGIDPNIKYTRQYRNFDGFSDHFRIIAHNIQYRTASLYPSEHPILYTPKGGGRSVVVAANH